MANIDLQETGARSAWTGSGLLDAIQDALGALVPGKIGARRLRLWAHLTVGDLLAYLIAVCLLDLAFLALEPLLASASARPTIALGAAVFIGSNIMLGVYASARLDPWETVRRRVIALFAFFVTMLIVVGYESASWPYLPALAMLSLLLLVVAHFVESGLRALPSLRDAWVTPALVVCRDAEARRFAEFLQSNPEIGLSPRILDIPGEGDGGEAAQAAQAEAAARLAALLGKRRAEGDEPTPEVVILTDAKDVAALSRDWPRGVGAPRLMLAQDRRQGLSIRERARALGAYTGFALEASPLYDRSALAMKRLVDLPIALVAGLLALPLIGLAALAVYVIDPGPVFFSQSRIGRSGRPFSILKLRSMYRDADERLERHLAENPAAAEEWRRFFKLRNDPRILPIVGPIIRRSSIDELPQIWNIVKGDMSVVGPRPFPSYHLDSFDAEFQAIRASVPPGLTGYWQVTERSDGDLAAQQECDLYYIRNWSIWLDLYLILQTVPAVLTGHGAR